MAEPIGALRVLLSATAAQFEKDLAVARKSLSNLGPPLAQVAKAAAVAGAAVTAALAAIVKSTADTGDAFAKMSQRVGVSVEDLSAISHAAKLSDVSLEQLGTSMGRLARTMSDADNGLATAKRSFADVGIEVKNADGSLRPIRDVLLNVADRFAGMTDETKKAALAQELFGRSGLQMIPLLNQGSAAIREQMQEAERLGIVWSTDAAKAAEAFNDNLTRLQAAVQGVKEAIGRALLPILADLTGRIAEFVQSDRFRGWAEGIATTIKTSVGPSLIFLGRAFITVQNIVRTTMIILAGIAQAILAVNIAIREGGQVLRRWTGDVTKESVEKLDELWTSFRKNNEAIFSWMQAIAGSRQDMEALEESLKTLGKGTSAFTVENRKLGTSFDTSKKSVIDLKSVMDPELVEALAIGQRAVFQLRQETDDLVTAMAKAGLAVRSISDPELLAALQAGKDAVADIRKESEDAGRAGQEAAMQIKSISDPELLEALQIGQDAVARMRYGFEELGKRALTTWEQIKAAAASAWQSMTQTVASSIVSMIQGIATVGDFFRAVIGSMLSALVNFVVQMVAQWISALVQRQTAETAALTAHTAIETAKTTVTATQETARGVIVAAGAKVALGAAGATLAGVAAVGEAAMAVVAAVGAATAAVLAAIGAALTATVVGAGLAAGYFSAAAIVGAVTAATVAIGVAAIAAAVAAAGAAIAGALAVPLASGGIVTGPTLSLVGEAGPEAVLPLSQLDRMLGGGEREQAIFVMLDGRLIAKTMVRGMPREIRVQAGVRA